MQLSLTCPLLGTWPETQACAQTGSRTCDPLVCRPALNPLNHTIQGRHFFFQSSLLRYTLYTVNVPITSSIQFCNDKEMYVPREPSVQKAPFYPVPVSPTPTLGAGSYCSFCHHGVGFFPMGFHTVGSLLCLASFT